MIGRAPVPTGSGTGLYGALRGSFLPGVGRSRHVRPLARARRPLYDRSGKAGTCPKNRDRFMATNAPQHDGPPASLQEIRRRDVLDGLIHEYYAPAA